MKTLQEMKKAVLAYCEDVCPRNGQQHTLYDGAYLRAHIDGYGIYHYWGGLRGGNSTCFCSISTHSTSLQVAEFSAFYSLLGLEARDAVAELEARNTALVAALEGIQAQCSGDPSAWDNGMLVRTVEWILEKSNTAIKSNTEKGGVQG